jgi:hypothetical protein
VQVQTEALPARSFSCKVAEPDVTHVARPSACTFVTRPSWLERPREKASAPTKKKRPVPYCNTFQPRTVRGRRQSSFSLLPWPRRRAILTGFPFGLSGAGQRCGDGCRSRPGGSVRLTPSRPRRPAPPDRLAERSVSDRTQQPKAGTMTALQRLRAIADSASGVGG